MQTAESNKTSRIWSLRFADDLHIVFKNGLNQRQLYFRRYKQTVVIQIKNVN